MNTIIWKGIPSTRIEGLLICDLPPISKPPLRVKETTVDGRDGSTYDDLGYSSYTKSITIGLRGNFDINHVIKYFTGEGEIVFSNEPEKVYQGKIIGQIDYNRLLRFRQAVVKFNIQPFKHKYLEAYKEPQTVTASGTSIVVTDGANANLKAFSIYGKTTQDGIPTPSAPIDLVSVGEGGNLGVSATRKNLLPITAQTVTLNGCTVTINDDKTITLNGICTENSSMRLGYFTHTGTFTMSGGVTSKEINSSYIISVVDGQSNVYWGGKDIIFTNTASSRPFDLVVIAGTYNNATIKPMIRHSSIDDATYEPYEDQAMTTATPNGLCGIPVTSGGNYTDPNGQRWICDEIDLARGVYVQRVHKLALNTVESWRKTEIDTIFQVTTILPFESKWVEGLCTHFQVMKWYNVAFNPYIRMVESGKQIYFEGDVEQHTTVEDWVSFLAEEAENGTPVELLYVLATPIETALSAEELEAYANMHTNEPNTTVLNDANANMKVEYFKPFEVFNEGLENSKPIMVLHGNGTVGISVNGIHIFDYTFPEGETEVVIDSEKQDAYLGEVLKNRNMNGEFPVLLAGTNKIEWSGYVESIEILPRSRWL